jgi:predicted nucleic acid-binding protein
VKLAIQERESEQLRAYLSRRPELASSALLRTEAVRAVRHLGPQAVARTTALFAGVRFVPLTADLLDVAALLDPPLVRSLDAIHVAAAVSLGDELETLVTYDDRMIEAAGLLGLRIASPS